MTHSLHRQGTYANLGDDFVILISPPPGRDTSDLQMLNQVREIGSRYQPVNVPVVKTRSSLRHLVYDSQEKVAKVLKDLAAADLEPTVLVSGLRDQVAQCCRDAGLSPTLVNQSLGLWGRIQLLPDFQILEITTMCGHGRITPNLVWELVKQMRQHSIDAGEAARRMGKDCLCGMFNEVRAARLVEKLIAGLEAGTIAGPPPRCRREITTVKDSGIIIDEAKCIRCLDCLPYCPVAAIVESPDGKTVFIDPDLCIECGLCRQVAVCPVDAIAARDLTWPRSLRGKFHRRYAPYKSASPTLAPTPRPVPYREEAKQGDEVVFFRHEFPDLHDAVDSQLRHDEAVIIVELGRPHLGTTFHDVQKVIRALVPLGLQLKLQYPNADERSSLAELATDVANGTLMPEILPERTGCVWLRLMATENNVPEVLRSLRQVATEIDTVFALDILSRIADDGFTVADRVARQTGAMPAPNCKTNVGLGHLQAKN